MRISRNTVTVLLVLGIPATFVAVARSADNPERVAQVAGDPGPASWPIVDNPEPDAERKQREKNWQLGPPFGEAVDSAVLETLKVIANDPTSVTVEASVAMDGDIGNAEDGWIVTCNYRGANAFGARILNTSTFRTALMPGGGYFALPQP